MEPSVTPEKLYEKIQKMELATLRTYPPDWIYDALVGICTAEGKEITLENLVRYSGLLDVDLYMMFNS